MPEYPRDYTYVHELSHATVIRALGYQPRRIYINLNNRYQKAHTESEEAMPPHECAMVMLAGAVGEFLYHGLTARELIDKFGTFGWAGDLEDLAPVLGTYQWIQYHHDAVKDSSILDMAIKLKIMAMKPMNDTELRNAMNSLYMAHTILNRHMAGIRREVSRMYSTRIVIEGRRLDDMLTRMMSSNMSA